MTTNQETIVMDGENVDEATILRTLVQGEEGKEWADERKKGWSKKSTVAVCDWDGIECENEEGSVLSIRLPQTDLLATIPTELALLSTLNSIDLQENMLQGTIPSDLASMKNLTKIILKKNKLKGILPRFESQQLQLLDLSHNQLSGEIPHDLGEDCVLLKYIDLQHNQFVGFLPFGLEDLPELETISISYNNLTGTLPAYLSGMNNLKFLYLNHNRLVGTIPNDLGKVDPNASVISESLREVWFQNNILSGTIPVSLAESTALVDLFLDGNKLVGSVPEILCNQSTNADFSSGINQTMREKCDSISCRAGTISVEGVFPCRPCTTTIENPYLGRKGECDDLTEAQIVDMFLGKEDVDVLDSACDYDGVLCNKEMKVVEIVVPGLGLTGELPDDLGYLSMLSKLDVSDNALTGYFPSGLRFAPLTSIHIAGNKLKGIIPPLMCEKAESINGDNDDDCTSIACPMGTFSKDETGFGECIPCPGDAHYLGSTECLSSADTANPQQGIESRAKRWDMIFDFLLFFMIFAVIGKIAVTFILHKRKKKHDGPNGAQWLQNHLSRNYHYLISLTETEAVNDPPGVNSSNVASGEIDDYGWQERDSILKHRDIENAVEAQQKNPKLEVWEYPDPLESPQIYKEAINEEDFLITGDGEDDLISFMKQQEDADSREVWLDVPRVS